MTNRRTPWGNPRIAALIVASTGILFSQSSPVGNIAGVVKGPDGKALGGALVQAITSRGTLEERTSARGEFSFRQLVPGSTRVKVSAPGTAGFTSAMVVVANQTSRMDIKLAPAGVTVEVVASAPVETVDTTQAQTGLVMTMDQIDSLPIMYTGTERLDATVFRTPGAVFDNIHGTDSQQNTYLVDGVSAAGANYGGRAVSLNNDFIDQVQVLTSGISAKYGRFTGGVITVTTKSGTNEFSGSTRLQITNEKWNSKYRMPGVAAYYSNKYHFPLTWSPVPDTHAITQSYTFTGPIIKDKLFFAVAYQTNSPQTRMHSTTTPSLGVGVPYDVLKDQSRLDTKIDWQMTPGQRLSGEINETKVDETNSTSNGVSTTLATLSGHSVSKTGYRSMGYLAQISSSLSLDVKLNDTYSKSGGPGTGPTGGNVIPTWKEIKSSDVLDNGFGSDQESKSHMTTGAANLLWIVEAAGTHELETGFQFYHYNRTGAAAETPSGYLVNFRGYATGATTWDPASRILTRLSSVDTNLESYTPVRGEADSKVNSIYVNDTWNLDTHWKLTLGARFDQYKSETTPENITYDFKSFTPRLGLGYDLHGDSVHVFNLSLAEYSGMILQGDLASATVTSSPILKRYVYLGSGGANQGRGSDALLPDGSINWQVWGNSAGAVGKANPDYVADPLTDRNVFVDPNIKAPRTREASLGYHYTTPRESFSAALIRRWNDRFLDNFYYGNGMRDGLARIVIKNDPNAKNDYYGLEMTYRRQLGSDFSVGGNATWSRAFGNAGVNLGGASSQANNFGVGNIPESQLNPRGPSVGQDVPVAMNLDANYRKDVGGGATLSAGLIGTYKSGSAVAYQSATANTSSALKAQGYESSYTRYFPELGVVRQPEIWNMDLQLGYDQKLVGKVVMYAKVNISNVFNRVRAMTRDTSGTVAGADGNPYPADGSVPSNVFVKGETYGIGQGNWFPRTVQAVVGFRF